MYLNFLWIKCELEDLKIWSCSPIRKTGALAIVPNHCGNRFLFSQSNRQRTCLQEHKTFYFRSNKLNFSTNIYVLCLKAELDSSSVAFYLHSVHFIFCSLWMWSITLWPIRKRTTAALQSHPILQTQKCLF